MPRKMFPSSVPPARLKQALGAGDDYGVTDPPDWRSTDWPALLHQMEIEGRSVNYVDIGEQGTDRPIVFIHGLGGQWQNWLENIPRFAQERRVIAMDLPGFGCSDMPAAQISIELYGRVVAEMLQRLDAAPAVLVGNSMGGYVSSEVAIRAPEVVERLMLVASAGVSQMDLAERPLLAMTKATGLLASGNLAQVRASALRPRLRHWFLSIVARHPSRIKADAAFEAMMKGMNKPGFEPALVANLRYDFRERLPQIGCPVLVVWGDKDMIIPVRDADTFLELIPGARKVIMEDTGHIPMLERPVTFNNLLAEFLAYEVSEGELEGELEPPGPVSS